MPVSVTPWTRLYFWPLSIEGTSSGDHTTLSSEIWHLTTRDFSGHCSHTGSTTLMLAITFKMSFDHWIPQWWPSMCPKDGVTGKSSQCPTTPKSRLAGTQWGHYMWPYLGQSRICPAWFSIVDRIVWICCSYTAAVCDVPNRCWAFYVCMSRSVA